MAGALIVSEAGTNGDLACELMRAWPMAQRGILGFTALVEKLTMAGAMRRMSLLCGKFTLAEDTTQQTRA